MTTGTCAPTAITPNLGRHLRPTRWTQTNELLLVLSIIEHTIEVTPKAARLLAQIVEGPLIPSTDLPTPTPANRKPPRTLG